MEDRNLDVWAIQYMPEELDTALSNLKVDGNTILYTNALCAFKVGTQDIVSKQFDTFLYNEENDLFVMFMRGGQVTSEDVRSYLDNHKIDYNEVVFAPSFTHYEDDNGIPELWTTRDESGLEGALEDTIEKGLKLECDYYPELVSSIDLSYFSNSSKDPSKRCSVDGRVFKGVIKMEGKLILLVGQDDERNVRPARVYELLEEYGFKCNVCDGEPSLLYTSKKGKAI